MNHKIILADVIDGLRSLENQSVQCVVTSPPYWGLRDYGVEGQIGLEKTPEEYITKMVEVFREVKRVLRDDGTLWLNIGDCYATNGVYIGKYKETHPEHQDLHTKNSERYQNRKGVRGGEYQLKAKDLVGIPWRLAFALQADGWYLRSDIIWSKPNPMPESVTDRPTKAHEYIFLLTKKAKYFYDADAVREAQTGTAHSRGKGATPKGELAEKTNRANNSFHVATSKYLEVPGGRNRRTVWEIATQPTTEAHFATFPDALVEPCIKAGTSERGCCPKCRAPWKRVVEVSGGTIGKSWHPHENDAETGQIAGMSMEGYQRQTTGWEKTCECGYYPIPCVVLDPFGGSGTVADVARRLGRSSILIEINEEYVNIMKKRLRFTEQLDTGVCTCEVIKV